ncbi:MAG: HD domain-containing protein [Treponema sp.]|nr:HD domain-containing protein [Treponema sp.]
MTNNSQNPYKPYQIIILVLFCMVTNVGGRVIADTLNLPLWADCFGTFLAAYALGPVCGAIVGISGNILHGLINPISFVYALTSVFIAVIVGVMARRGWLESLLKTMSLSVLVTLVCTFISVVLNVTFYGGDVGNDWGNGIVELFTTWGLPHPVCIVLGQFYVDFLDKVFTLVLLFLFLRAYRGLKPFLPEILRLSDSKGVTAAHRLRSGDGGRALREFAGQTRYENIDVLAASADAPLPDGNAFGGAPIPNAKSTTLLILFLFLVPLFAPQEASAQSRNYNAFAHTVYNKENGLSGGKANDIASTNDGILWIGTYEGLYRHNGHEFRLMNEFDSIKAVRTLYVDDEGRLFVGTNDNGLSIIINETVMNVLEEKDGLPADAVRSITRSSDGLYYVGTAEDLAVLTIADGLKVVETVPRIQTALSLSADENGHIAAVTAGGEFFLLDGSKIMWDASSTGEKFTATSFAPDGRLYASTESGKMLSFSLTEDELVLEKTLSCKSFRHINSLEFHDNLLFLCADNGAGYLEDGVIYEIETGSFNNSIDNMTEDYQGNLWFTSSRLGLLKMCETSFSEIYASAGLPISVVNSTARFGDDLYFATDDGLFAIDEDTGLPLTNALTNYLSGTRIRCLCPAQDGSLWIATKSRGLVQASADGKISSLGQTHQFRVVLALSDGTIAAGAGDGIAFVRDGKILQWLGESDGFENLMILSLGETAGGLVLAGTDGGGLALISKTESRFKIERLIKRSDGLSSNVILRTVNDYDEENPTGSVFVVTSNGLCYISFSDTDGSRFTGKSDGISVRKLSNFPYANNYDLVVWKNKNIFVTSSAGIFVVNRDELLSGGKLDHELLDLKKGLRGSFTANSWNHLDENGDLYLSCDTGASKINLNTYDKAEYSYRIQLKSVLLDGRRHIVQKDIPFVIPAETDTVEIVPEIINYSINTPYISVFLEGVDEKPKVYLQNDLPIVNYTDLRAGDYRFHIAVLDSKGREIVEESVYTLTKTFKIYNKWYFMLYTVGVAALAIIWLTWYVTASVQGRRAEKQKREIEAIRQQVRMGNETIFAIANAVEARDKSTGRHSFRVSEYAVMIARELGFDENELEQIRRTGLLHDIGKIGVPDSILNKPARLTDEEYEVMKTHTSIGGDILKDFTLIPHVDEGAKFHHERYDGSGYPNGLKGEEIPLNARIIGIADAFDAMTANRVYRKALNIDFVKAELKRCAGSQFDPTLVEIMLELIESGEVNVSRTVEESTKSE